MTKNLNKKNMKIFENLGQLIEQAKIDKACKEGMQFLYSCEDLQDVFNNVNLEYCIWAIQNGYIQFEDHIDWNILTDYDFLNLLKVKPQLSKYCNIWEQFDGSNICYLLSFQPQFADKFDLKKLNVYQWRNLLENNPEFAEKCEIWDKFEVTHWVLLLKFQPKLAKYCKIWDKFDSISLSYILECQPQLAKKIYSLKNQYENI